MIMKKQLLIVGGAIVWAIVTLAACGTSGNGRVISQDTRTNTAPTASSANVAPGGGAAQSGTPSGSTNTVTYITEEQAKEIAFTHAAVNKDNVSLLRVQFDYDDWRAVYEVDFYCEYNEYDYDIDAVTGDIVGYDVDMEHYIGAIPQNGNTSAANQNTQAAAPDTQNAQAAAPAAQNTQDAAPAAQNTQAAAPDTQNTQTAAQNTQAATPAAQTVQAAAPVVAAAPTPAPAPAPAPAATPAPAPSNSTNNSWISSTDAENAALSHAGVSSSSVSYLRSHLDRDDGRTMYEVSFYYNYMEYEYDIDALTGNILSFDQDYD
jgi:uncharacterized membrane protein YkoI